MCPVISCKRGFPRTFLFFDGGGLHRIYLYNCIVILSEHEAEMVLERLVSQHKAAFTAKTGLHLLD